MRKKYETTFPLQTPDRDTDGWNSQCLTISKFTTPPSLATTNRQRPRKVRRGVFSPEHRMRPNALGPELTDGSLNVSTVSSQPAQGRKRTRKEREKNSLVVHPAETHQ